MNLLDRQHLWQRGDVLELEHLDNFPVTLAGVREEELDAREGHAE